MADEQEQQPSASAEDQEQKGDGPSENKRPDDTLASDKKCPECGEPVDDVRATCINCGYEYKDEDHEDLEAGSEFVAGSQIDDEGNELPDEEPAPESEEDVAESEEDAERNGE